MLFGKNAYNRERYLRSKADSAYVMLKKCAKIIKVITRLIALATLCSLGATGCMVHPVTLEREFNVVSEHKECSIGRGAHPQILKQFGYYHNPELQSYVRDVGKKLVGVCRRRDIDYHFTVLDTDQVNAFAVPGGYVYITRGMLAYLNSEAELAGVLGHEIGHIVGRDSAALISQSMIAQLATIAGVAGAAASESGGDLAMATNQLFNSLMLGFSREREYLADEQSVEYTFKAGYDPQQIISFMQTLSYLSQGPAGHEQYLMTHPFIFDRIARVEAKCKTMQALHNTMGQINGSAPESADDKIVRRHAYKEHLDGLAFGPKDDIRRIKIYTVRNGDTLREIARRTLGSATEAQKIARLNGLPARAQLIPGAKIKIIY